MNRRITWAFGLVILASALLGAQAINDTFDRSMNSWTPGAGTWQLAAGRLVQANTSEHMARIDRVVDQSRPYTIEFAIRYEGGGYESTQDLQNGYLHGGFGIHIGVENPALRGKSWGAGNSYLLWANLDTRPATRASNPEHAGLRLQVYKSNSNTSMSLLRDPAVSNGLAARYVHRDYVSVDLERLLADMGIRASLQDIATVLQQEAVIRLTIEPRTGKVTAALPGIPQPVSFVLPDASVLNGNYLSLRTNAISASFDYVRVTY